MNTLTKTLMMLGLSVIVALSSCNKQTDPTPLQGTNFVYGISLNTDNNTGALQFTAGTVTVTEINWSGRLSGNTDSLKLNTAVKTSFDLATGTATPEIPVTEIEPGNYDDIYIGIELFDNGTENNMVLEGSYTNGAGEVIPVIFEFKSGEVFEATLTSYSIPNGTDVEANLVLDPVSWFKNISQTQWENANVNGSGQIIISGSSNANIFDLVADELGISTGNGSIEFIVL